jgi:hypothetical protein
MGCSSLTAESEITRTIDNCSFCPECTSRHTVEVTGGRCYRGNTIVSYDTSVREWIGTARENGWERSENSREWYEHPENMPCEPFSYHTNVFDHCESLHTFPSNKLLLGVELEMEPRCPETEAQTEIVKRLNGPAAEHYICTTDGSLNYGVEMVTMPLTLEEHKGVFGWEGVLGRVANIAKSGKGTQNCGMHVHINKRALTPLTIGKMMVFLNADRTDSLVAKIAQRRNNGFCEKKDGASLKDARRYAESRYQRLNLQPSETVELRLFKGNLRPERVLKNLEFAHATVCFCKDASMKDVDSPAAFLAFIHKHRGTYPNLTRFLQETHTSTFTRAFNRNPIEGKAAAPVLEEI